jgi:hypothetical protein
MVDGYVLPSNTYLKKGKLSGCAMTGIRNGISMLWSSGQQHKKKETYIQKTP